MTAPVFTFVLTRRRKQKTRLLGRVVVAAVRRALTHHSLNGDNNQRNGEETAVHMVKNDLAVRLLSITCILALFTTLQITFYLLHFCVKVVLLTVRNGKKAF
jgi:hypothetical protein